MGEAGFGRRAAACSLTSPKAKTPPTRILYGRRRGRALRARQERLINEWLPGVRVRLPTSGRLDPRSLFDAEQISIWLEIGFGGGEHLARQAEHHPTIGLIGCEVFENGIVKLLARLEHLSLRNIRVFADDARLLVSALQTESIDRVFILFPDPWPKRRHHKRRIVSCETLDSLAEIMTDNAELRLASDDDDYLCWMLERVTAHPAFKWLARRPSDWRERPPDWPPTRYEEKAQAAGRSAMFLRIARRPRIRE